MFLPDTNILIYAFGGLDPYASWLSTAIKNKKLVLSTMIISEFLSGATKKDEVNFCKIMDKSRIFDVDRKVAETAALYKKEFIRKTKKIWLIDCLIAATCKVNKLTFVTTNKKDFPFKDIKILDEKDLK